MKRLIEAACVAAAAVVAALAAGCAAGTGVGGAEVKLLACDETCAVAEATAGDSTKSFYDALAAFEEAGELTIGGSESEFGFYLTSFNGKEATDEYFWGVYTTLGTWEGVSYSDASYGTWEYGGRTLASASYGVSGLPLVEGELYALVWTKIGA